MAANVVSETTLGSRKTVGAAIEELENILANNGVIISIKSSVEGTGPFSTQTAEELVDPVLLRLSPVIEIGISNAIGRGNGNQHSVGTFPACLGILKTGNVVALYSKEERFLRLSKNQVDFGGGKRARENLPIHWTAERFLVVNAGNGLLAFFNPFYRRFISVDCGEVSGKGYPVANLDDRPRLAESFTVEKIGEGAIALFSPMILKYVAYKAHKLFITDDIQYHRAFDVVQVNGFEPSDGQS